MFPLSQENAPSIPRSSVLCGLPRAQLSKSSLTENNADYFVYNELSDKFTRIGLSYNKGILTYAQNGATVSNDNLVTGNNVLGVFRPTNYF